MDIPILVRSNELRQLHNWIPEVCGTFQRAGLDDEAEKLQHFHEEQLEPPYDDVDHPAYVSYVSAEQDVWSAAVMGLERIKDDEGANRVWYLQKKLSNRLEQRIGELEND